LSEYKNITQYLTHAPLYKLLRNGTDGKLYGNHPPLQNFTKKQIDENRERQKQSTDDIQREYPTDEGICLPCERIYFF
jgi:hypothetical protein